MIKHIWSCKFKVILDVFVIIYLASVIIDLPSVCQLITSLKLPNWIVWVFFGRVCRVVSNFTKIESKLKNLLLIFLFIPSILIKRQ